MPNVSNYDNEEDWMAACVPAMIDEGRDQDQAVAACMNMWRNRNSEEPKQRGNSPMEYKSFVQQVKQIEGRIVTGFAAIFGNVDSGGDRTWKGAFKKTLKERRDRVQHLWQHDLMSPPTAVIHELEEVDKKELPSELLEKFPDATGGLRVVREYLNTTRGNEIFEGLTKGAIKEMSFGYDPIKWDFEGDATKGDTIVRNLRECRLWDTSDVNWGMNEATIASKSDPAIVLANLLSNIKAAQGFNSAALEKAGRVLSASNLEKLKAALETLTMILTAAEPTSEDDGKTVPVAALTDGELATLKARWDELQRQLKLYPQ